MVRRQDGTYARLDAVYIYETTFGREDALANGIDYVLDNIICCFIV